MTGRQRLHRRDVQPRATDPSLGERVHERVLVHNRAAPHVDQHAARLHGADRGGINHLRRARRVRQRQHDEVTLLHRPAQLRQREHLVHARVAFALTRIPSKRDDAHAHRLGSDRARLSDVAVSHDAHRLPL